jgi:hypothetical protein
MISRLLRLKISDLLSYAKYNVLKIIYIKYTLYNLFAQRPINSAKSNVIISLTTYSPRLRSVYYTIESIALGYSRPNQVILWLCGDDLNDLPRSLKRLQSRGLKIRECEDSKSYKKLVPVASLGKELDGVSYVMTADDDLIYPRNWLDILPLYVSSENRKQIFSQRARQVTFKNGGLDDYANWPVITRDNHIADAGIFPTGGAGSCYPVDFLRELSKLGDEFKDLAPEQDDIWFWAVSKHSKFGLTLINNPEMEKLVYSPGTQRVSLWDKNQISDLHTHQTANDVALAKVIDRFKIVVGQ